MTYIVRKAIRTVCNWMWAQMYGPQATEWTYGDGHDKMAEAYDFLQMLLKKVEWVK